MTQWRKALKKTYDSLKNALPLILLILLIINFVNPLLTQYYSQIFTGNVFFDPLLGSLLGSISFGIPIIGYVAGGELLQEGVSLLAVTAFIFSWIAVGFMMLPLEISHLGKKFALLRNVTNFFIAIVIAILTVTTLQYLSL